MAKKKTKEKKKKELKDCSKKELMKLVREQHDHIKTLQSDVEYVNGVNKANDLLIAGAMKELDVKILRVSQATREDVKKNYVLHWERDAITKDMKFQLEDRESYEKRKKKNEKTKKQDNIQH